MKKLLEKNPWPTAIVLVAMLAMFAIIWVFAEPSERADMLTGVGVAGGVILALLRSIIPDSAKSVLLVAAMSLGLMACGGLSAETRAAYSLEATRCLANERAIVDRPGTTLEQDEADLAQERARCDAALDDIENGGQ